MRTLDKLDKLVQVIRNDADIQRFKELETLIDQNEEIQKKYKKLLDAQKIMVQWEVKKHKDYQQAKEYYESLKAEILEYVIMEEYLDLLELINNDVDLIQSIIEEEISKDFD